MGAHDTELDCFSGSVRQRSTFHMKRTSHGGTDCFGGGVRGRRQRSDRNGKAEEHSQKQAGSRKDPASPSTFFRVTSHELFPSHMVIASILFVLSRRTSAFRRLPTAVQSGKRVLLHPERKRAVQADHYTAIISHPGLPVNRQGHFAEKRTLPKE